MANAVRVLLVTNRATRNVRLARDSMYRNSWSSPSWCVASVESSNSTRGSKPSFPSPTEENDEEKGILGAGLWKESSTYAESNYWWVVYPLATKKKNTLTDRVHVWCHTTWSWPRWGGEMRRQWTTHLTTQPDHSTDPPGKLISLLSKGN